MKLLQKLNAEIKQTSRPIRIQGVVKKRKETLEEFLVKFFSDWNLEKNTLYADTDKALQLVQTEPGKRRSMGDIFLIAKYYYPHCTLRQVSDIVYNKLFNQVPRFRSSYCNTIKKRVFYKGTNDQSSTIYDAEEKDEYGLTVQQWKDST